MALRRRYRKPDLFMVLVVITGLGVVITTSVYGGERRAGMLPTALETDRQRTEPAMATLAMSNPNWWDTGADILSQAAGEGWHVGGPRGPAMRLGLDIRDRPLTAQYSGPVGWRQTEEERDWMGEYLHQSAIFLSVGRRW